MPDLAASLAVHTLAERIAGVEEGEVGCTAGLAAALLASDCAAVTCTAKDHFNIVQGAEGEGLGQLREGNQKLAWLMGWLVL